MGNCFFFENYNYMPIVPVVILRAIWYISSSEFEKTIYGSFCTRKLCVCSPKYAGYRKAWLLIWKNIKRRPRYKGTHPRKFEEKYKELNPEKYADTVAKVISKGSTPAGMHISIMVKEILDFLQIQPGQKGLDATLGYGGHTRKMLEQLQGQGHLYGLDVDPIEIVKTTQRLRDAGFGEDIFTSIQENFANIAKVAQEYGPFDFMLADLGVSSMQIDNPERGFSYKLDGHWT